MPAGRGAVGESIAAQAGLGPGEDAALVERLNIAGQPIAGTTFGDDEGRV